MCREKIKMNQIEFIFSDVSKPLINYTHRRSICISVAKYVEARNDCVISIYLSFGMQYAPVNSNDFAKHLPKDSQPIYLNVVFQTPVQWINEWWTRIGTYLMCVCVLCMYVQFGMMRKVEHELEFNGCLWFVLEFDFEFGCTSHRDSEEVICRKTFAVCNAKEVSQFRNWIFAWFALFI